MATTINRRPALFDGGIPVWYENAGNAAWAERPVAEIVHLEGSLQVADLFDGDGDLDLTPWWVEGCSGITVAVEGDRVGRDAQSADGPRGSCDRQAPNPTSISG